MMFYMSCFALLLLFLSGCTGKTILLRGEQGDIAKCEVRAGETYLTGIIIRDLTLAQCIKQYEAAGYKRIEVPE